VQPGPAPQGTPVALWRAESGVIAIPPLVRTGIAYAGDAAGLMHAWDLATGIDLWPADRRQFGGGFWGGEIADDTLYTSTGDRVVHAIDLATYRERWQFTGAADKTIPQVVGDAVFVGVEGAVVALAMDTGAELWRVPVRGSMTYFAYADGILYATAILLDGGVNAIDVATHRLLWRFETGAPQVLSPAVAGGTIFAAAQDAAGRNSAVFALDATTGAERWRFQTPAADNIGSLAVGNRFVYVGTLDPHRVVTAVDRTTGAQAWQIQTDGGVSRLSIVDGLLLGTVPGHLAALDLESGALRWSIPTVGYGGGTTVTDGMVLVPCCFNSGLPGSMAAFVGPDDPRLAAIATRSTPAPSPTLPTEIARLVRSFGFDDTPALWLSLAVAPDGRIYVADMANHRILEWTSDGKPLRSIGTKGSAPGQFDFTEVTPADSSTSIAIGSDGTIAVGDGANHRIQLFDPQFRFIRAIGALGRGPGQFVNACCVGWTPAGNILVADPGRNDIQELTRAGKLVRTIGKEGSGPGQFYRLGPPSTDAAGNVFVPDFSNRRIEKFDPQGNYLESFGTDSDKGPLLAETNTVFVDAAGRMFVGDGAGRIVVMAPDGRVLAFVPPLQINGRGYPGISALGADGLIYLVDPGEGSPGHVAIMQLLPPFAP
jgi:outer membrane protein assembly factor BamB